MTENWKAGERATAEEVTVAYVDLTNASEAKPKSLSSTPCAAGPATDVNKRNNSDRDVLVNELKREYRGSKRVVDKSGALRAIASQINLHAEGLTDSLLEMALLIKKSRAEFQEGENGTRHWLKWAGDNINLRESRVRELLRVANSPNPVMALADLRDRTKKRVAKHREHQKLSALRNGGESEKECFRQKLADWAMYADEKSVMHVWSTASALMPVARLPIANELEMHIYVHDGHPLTPDAIITRMKVNRDEAIRLLQYGLDAEILRRSQAGRLIKSRRDWGVGKIQESVERFGSKAGAILQRFILGWDAYYLKHGDVKPGAFDYIWEKVCGGEPVEAAFKHCGCNVLRECTIYNRAYYYDATGNNGEPTGSFPCADGETNANEWWSESGMNGEEAANHNDDPF